MGWLTRRGGLSIDNLVSAEVVTADGRVLQASEGENPDLFWAIRGGGGNFGVVTRFEFNLHPVGPLVHFALLFWALEDTAAVLRLAEELNTSLPPDGFTFIVGGLNAPPAPFVPEEHRFRPGAALLIAGFGSQEEHAAVVTRVREQLPPLFWRQIGSGCDRFGRRSSPSRLAAAPTSMAKPSSSRTEFETATARPSTSVWQISRPSMTPTTSST